MKVWMPAARAGSGTDVFTEYLAAGLRKRGVDVVVTWFSSRWQLAPMRIPYLTPPPGTTLIHINSWSGGTFSRFGIPVIATVHLVVHDALLMPYKNTAQKIFHRALVFRKELRALQGAAAVAAVSRYVANRVGELFPRVKPYVIHNGVDTSFFSPANDMGSNASAFRLLFVGNPTRRKGFDLFPGIMDELGEGYELYYTAGRNGKIQSDNRRARCLGRLAGADLLAAYRTADAVVLPSRCEGFGLAACEAMACGRPVVAANNSGHAEVIENGVSGFLCPTDDVRAFADAIQLLKINPALRRKIGVAARHRVEQMFSLEKMVDQYLRLYEQTVDTGR